MRASGEIRTLTPVEGTSVWDWRVCRFATEAWTPRTCRGACAEGGEHDSQRVTPSNHLANDPGAPVRFTLREGRRGCVSPAQLPHQDSDLDYLIQSQRCYRLHHEASCARDAGRSRTGIARRHRFADGWLTVHPQRHESCEPRVGVEPTTSPLREGRSVPTELPGRKRLCSTVFLRAPPGNRTRHLLLTKEVLYH